MEGYPITVEAFARAKITWVSPSWPLILAGLKSSMVSAALSKLRQGQRGCGLVWKAAHWAKPPHHHNFARPLFDHDRMPGAVLQDRHGARLLCAIRKTAANPMATTTKAAGAASFSRSRLANSNTRVDRVL